jgi:hypothetical protein
MMLTIVLALSCMDFALEYSLCRILFEGYFGRYLHTGDFRASESLCEMAEDIFNRGPIDRLFLDTTFINPFWYAFPTKVRGFHDQVTLLE